MTLDHDSCYRALRARDARFDGTFFVGVTTTGIYCRPICPARSPGRTRCRFFGSAAEAEREGFRACFRCRPELAPGLAAVDARSRLVSRVMARIEDGFLDDGSVEGLAADLGVSARHLRRVVESEIGASPVELAQTQRLALAKRLLHDSDLGIAELAHAAGFGSVRRFNSLFARRFGCAPSKLRRRSAPSSGGEIRLRLDYRPPMCWSALLHFLAGRAIPGVEVVRGDSYARSLRVGGSVGWVEVAPLRGRTALEVRISVSLAGRVAAVSHRLRAAFDLDARPDRIDEALARDRRLRRLVAARPGLRVPGACDPFELGVRTILGQQVSVAAASTLAGRMAESFGDPAGEGAPVPLVFPTAERVAALTGRRVQRIGLPAGRAQTIVSFARALHGGSISLERGADPEIAVRDLVALPGIGPWTAGYVAMRVLGWPDAFPGGDLGLRRALGCERTREVERRSEAWRPWRAYAAMHLWTDLASGG